QLEDFAADVNGDLARKVAACDGRRHFGDVAHLAGEVGSHEVDVVGEVLPCAGDAGHAGLATQFAVGADFAGHTRDFRREAIELIEHDVDAVLQLEDFAADFDCDLFREIAAGDGRRHVGDVSHLIGQVRSHRVNVVGQVLPCAGHTGDL